jgi:hypothetical protein
VQQGVGFRVVRPEGLELSTFWFVDRITFCVVRVFKRMEFRSAGKITVFGQEWASSVQLIVQK